MNLSVEPWKSTYKSEEDNFLHLKFAIAPCALLAILINENHFSLHGPLHAFSLYLEAIAIFPQFVVLKRYREIENLTAHYVAR